MKDARAALRARGLRRDRGRAPRPGRPLRRVALASAAGPKAPVALAFDARLARDPARARGAAGRGPRARARGAGRADGAQRGGQVDAAAARRRPDAADPRPDRARRPRLAAAPEPRATTWSPSAWGRSCPPPRSRPPGSPRSPTATRATSPAASASGSRSRSCCRASLPPSSASTSRPAAWTAATRTRSPRTCASWPAQGSAVLVATHDAEFAAAVGRADRAARRRRAGRRRADRRGARRRLVLRDPDRAHPRRLRAAARGGRGAPARGCRRRESFGHPRRSADRSARRSRR